MADGSALRDERLEAICKEIPIRNNKIVAELCGPFDRNLVEIEMAFGVQITRHGNLLRIHGSSDGAAAAARRISDLLSRVEAGKTVVAGEIARPRIEDAGRMLTIGRPVEPRNAAQKAYVHLLDERELVLGIGPAGTGKTYLAVAVAVSHLLAGKVERIILARPAVEAGERLGFLPGDMKEKVDPYMQPLYDALNDFLPARRLQKMLEAKTIEIAPLAFMRGRTLAHAFVVLDEAQNTTETQMKMFLTRLGEGSRMVITGDPDQIDLPRTTPSGLVQAARILAGDPAIGIVRFGAEDVVRHPLVKRILEAYAANDCGTRPAGPS